MTFNQTIGKIMHEVESSAKEPFIVFRNADGGWHCDTTVNQHGEKYDWVDDIQDPYAVTLTGAELAQGSFAHVYDRILNERLRSEYEKGSFPNTDPKELEALINMVEENISKFSSEVTEYLTLYDRPLAALYEMASTSLISGDYDYDHEQVDEVVDEIEDEVHRRLNKRKAVEIPLGEEQLPPSEQIQSNKYNIFGYEEKLSIKLAGKHVVFAENPNEEAPYLVCYVKNDNPLGLVECFNDEIFADYVEAMRGFADRLDGLVDELETERNAFGLSANPLTATACLPESENMDWENQLIIVKADSLTPEYRSAEHQLAICTGGFGSQPNAMGRAVYVEELYSGKKCRYDRHQIEGVADPAKLPQWAAKKLAEMNTKKEPLQNQREKPAKTLHDKLNNAKKKAASENATRKSVRKNKSKNGQEVE